MYMTEKWTISTLYCVENLWLCNCRGLSFSHNVKMIHFDFMISHILQLKNLSLERWKFCSLKTATFQNSFCLNNNRCRTSCWDYFNAKVVHVDASAWLTRKAVISYYLLVFDKVKDSYCNSHPLTFGKRKQTVKQKTLQQAICVLVKITSQ